MTQPVTDVMTGTLCSGSKGNCAVFVFGGRLFLVDAGRTAKYITEALSEAGLTPDMAEGIFITHPHNDHVSALKVFTKKHGIKVHAAGVTAYEVSDLCTGTEVISHPVIFNEQYGDVTVRSFVTSHDTECSVGYTFEYRGGKFGYATDLGCVTDNVRKALYGCRTVILEANHDVDMLMCGKYSFDLKQRILSSRGHLSNADCAAFAAELADHGTEIIILAHLSEENNLPQKAYDTVRKSLDASGHRDVRVLTALQDCSAIVSLNSKKAAAE